jgi:formamidase
MNAKQTLQIDRSKHLCDDPLCGHNRWHPDLSPRMEVNEGEEIGIETRDSADGYVTPTSTIADFANFPLGALHPLTGPVNVKGAKAGDLLEVEFLEIQAAKWGFSCVFPGMGYLADQFPAPFLAHWDLADGWATSKQIPGVRVPGAPFMGVSGVAPSKALYDKILARENDLNARGAGLALPPDPNGAVPAEIGKEGLRTMPPRENGGNLDTKQITKGAKLFLPVFQDGALFSTGDAHFCQGDGEVCLTAVEMGATAVVRFKVHKGAAEQRKIRSPYFSRSTYFQDPKFAAPERFIATIGMPIDHEGKQTMGDLNLATRNALLQMLDRVQERGFTREQAYVICSVACDLRISQIVDIPNFSVTAILSEDIFG